MVVAVAVAEEVSAACCTVHYLHPWLVLLPAVAQLGALAVLLLLLLPPLLAEVPLHPQGMAADSKGYPGILAAEVRHKTMASGDDTHEDHHQNGAATQKLHRIQMHQTLTGYTNAVLGLHREIRQQHRQQYTAKQLIHLACQMVDTLDRCSYSKTAVRKQTVGIRNGSAYNNTVQPLRSTVRWGTFAVSAEAQFVFARLTSEQR